MIKIIADSCCDLGEELTKRFDIGIIPLSVFINEKNYLDGVEIKSADLFRFVKEKEILPKTSAPSVLEFAQEFEKFDQTIYISISAKLSASFQSATLAKESLAKREIAIIDSLNLSTGIGLLVLKAAELAHAGFSIAEIQQTITDLSTKVHTSFVIDTLDYLFMGGRCSSMEHIIGSLLKIRPVIEVRRDGTLGVREKVSGSRLKALKALLKDFEKNVELIDPQRVFVTHAACEEDAIFLKTELEKIMKIEEICITEAGSTISSHCGPNCIGILYLTK